MNSEALDVPATTQAFPAFRVNQSIFTAIHQRTHWQVLSAVWQRNENYRAKFVTDFFCRDKLLLALRGEVL